MNNKKNKLKDFRCLALASLGVMVSMVPVGFAEVTSITNQLTIGFGPSQPDSSSLPVICVQDSDGVVADGCSVLAGQTLTADRVSQCAGPDDKGNYGTYAGASLRFGGCDNSDTYLGYTSLEPGTNTYSNAPALSVIDNYQVENGIVSGKSMYSAIQTQPQDQLTPTDRSDKLLPFVGINLSGLEFGTTPSTFTVPLLSSYSDYTTASDLDNTNTFLSKAHMNTIRLPLSWDYLQPDGETSKIDTNYFLNLVVPTLVTATQSKTHVIIDLHAYMHYSTYAVDPSGCGEGSACPAGKVDTTSDDYATTWGHIYQAIVDYNQTADTDKQIDTAYLMLDLVNEPADAPSDSGDITPAAALSVESAAIKTLEGKGFTGRYLIEGANWTGLHSWSEQEYQWSESDGTNENTFTRDNIAAQTGLTTDEVANRVVINVHQYFDSNFSGTSDTCITYDDNQFHVEEFAQYLKEQQLTAMVTEFGVSKNDSTGDCNNTMQSFLNAVNDNAATLDSDGNVQDGGFIGWTVWSTGHGWGDYNLLVTTDSSTFDVLADEADKT